MRNNTCFASYFVDGFDEFAVTVVFPASAPLTTRLKFARTCPEKEGDVDEIFTNWDQGRFHQHLTFLFSQITKAQKYGLL